MAYDYSDGRMPMRFFIEDRIPVNSTWIRNSVDLNILCILETIDNISARFFGPISKCMEAYVSQDSSLLYEK